MKYILILLACFFIVGCGNEVELKFPTEIMTEFHCFIPKENIKVEESKDRKVIKITNQTNNCLEILCSHVMLIPEYNRKPQIHEWKEKILPNKFIEIKIVNKTSFYYYYTIKHKNKEEILFLGIYSYFKK